MDPGQDDDPPQEEINEEPLDSYMKEDVKISKTSATEARKLLERIPVDTEEENRKQFIQEIKERKSIFPDAVMLRQFTGAGVNNVDPLVVRATGLIAQKYCGDIINECLMLIRVRGEGRINKVTKEVTYSLTHEVVEEVMRLKHKPSM